MDKKMESYIRTIPDFPEKGVMFRDITTLLMNPEGFRRAIDELCDAIKDLDFDVLVGSESRGFIFGTPIAYKLNKPFALIRKKGKLPAEKISVEYDLEYGKAVMEMHKDAIKKGDKVVLVDDLLATGGTMEAGAYLVEKLGGEVVKMIFLIELLGLRGREKLNKYDIYSIIQYPGK